MAQLKLSNFINQYVYDQFLSRQLQETKKARVRLYILDGHNFASKDRFSDSDPYLVIKCGKHEFNERKNYQNNTKNPKFYKCYDFSMEFPSGSPVEIIAYDFNNLFGDDLIGTTLIDLDDRYFSHDWKSIEHKPIEYRDLFHPNSSVSQGAVTCWLEILDKVNNEQIDVQPEP